ncbi:cysteine-rich receptor-like protein kinase 25 [Populus alba x Populus x berolinensis]|uniref:Cysteine-rich receptor-like protein kinase 25 n=1 Tax=Populus alba x Populus x berolinensis TaxID=444605 RepID=A0AAD6M3Y3_9ROSI|nr:cysteine-rich receptor-like protein kinase 25 [Populus alba x Populus x berolinensis]
MASSFPSFEKTIQFLWLCFFISNLLDLAHADPPYSVCSNNSNYSANSTFQNNLEILMSSIRSNASVSKLYYTSTGNDLDRIYAQYMCINYITHDSCSTCITAASQDIMQVCPGDKEAVVWEELCQLRYSNQSFLGHLDVSGNIAKDNQKDVENPEQFGLVVNETLSDLTKQVAFNASANMYATRQAAFTNTETLYALMQCSTDLSPDDCNTCLRVAMENISSCCDASRGGRVLSRSCYLRYELYAFYEGANESSKSPVPGKSSRRKTWIIIILTAAAAVLVVRDGLNDGESAFMDLESIYAATGNFSDSNLLGQGGFGPVYKVNEIHLLDFQARKMSDGKEVAVKRLSAWSDQGTDEFTNEVMLIMKLQHKNLVKLLGLCVDGDEKLLVYEFMPNRSLDVFLFDKKERARLNWRTRTGIVNGIAKGTLYLHEDSRHRIIHRDLKASNVLLDKDMNPKISDFGMARMFAGSEGEANTARIVGTYGYMAPEYAMEGLYSTKSDVFSFGVLLLEIITGNKNSEFNKSKRAPSLLAYAWQLWNEGKELELIDPLMADSCCSDEFSRYMHVGLLCVQEDPCERPTMSSVVLMLKRESSILTHPHRPAFSVGRFADYEANAGNCSVNALTISSISPVDCTLWGWVISMFFSW